MVGASDQQHPTVDIVCCRERGDILDEDGVNVVDLSYLVDYLFRSGPPPACLEAGNVDALTGPGGPIDVADLSYMVEYLFKEGPAAAPCL